MCEASFEIHNQAQLFKTDSRLYYRHDNNQIFSIDTSDLGHRGATIRVKTMPDEAVAYEPDPNSIEGQAVDEWTDRVDDKVRAGQRRQADNIASVAALTAT